MWSTPSPERTHRRNETRMSKPIVYIDGREGTTGLQIYDRLSAREDLELLLIKEEKRKDPEERARLINGADIVFLCLPDAAAIEAVGLADCPNTRIIDCSTAHRTAPGWDYGCRPFTGKGLQSRSGWRTPDATPQDLSPLSTRW